MRVLSPIPPTHSLSYACLPSHLLTPDVILLVGFISFVYTSVYFVPEYVNYFAFEMADYFPTMGSYLPSSLLARLQEAFEHREEL